MKNIGTADALKVVYDFDTLQEGTYSESEFSSLFPGVSFENTGGHSFLALTDKDPNNIHIRSSTDDQSDDYDDDLYNGVNYRPTYSTIATFDNLTDYVGVSFYTDSPHLVGFFMRIYDINHNILGQIETSHAGDNYLIGTSHPPDNFIYGIDFRSSTTNIASIEFWDTDYNYTFNGDSYWDNFRFNQYSAT
jgi:hypothetical protein